MDRLCFWECDECKDIVMSKSWKDSYSYCECKRTGMKLTEDSEQWKGPMPRLSLKRYSLREGFIK